MYVLNTSFHVDKSIEDRFLNILRRDYIPAIKNSGAFSGVSLMRILLEVEEGVSSFALGLRTTDMVKAMEWYDGEGAELRVAMHRDFGEKLVFFTTCMEEISI